MKERISVDRKFHVDHCGQKRMCRGGATPQPQSGRVPRVAKLMALAIRFDRLLRDGVVADQAELARLGHVSPARLSQVMALLQLAPEIQEAILFLPPTERGQDPVTERHLRPIAAVVDWGRQRKVWKKLNAEKLLANRSEPTHCREWCLVGRIK